MPGQVTARRLLSRGELAFFHVLRRAVRGRCAASLKSRLADVIHCPAEQWETPFGRRLAQKHVDLVLYDVQDARILAVIELDDRSHDRPDRKRRDAFLNALLSRAGIPLLRIRAAARYDQAELTRLIDVAVFGIHPSSGTPRQSPIGPS